MGAGAKVVRAKLCVRCNKKRGLTTKTGWLGAAPRARVCNSCQGKRRTGTTREQRLIQTYGLQLVDYAELFTYQQGVCAICMGKRPVNLDVDHSHKTNILRGLLCKRCNRRLLPASLDSQTVLHSAMQYLANPPAVQLWGERTVPSG